MPDTESSGHPPDKTSHESQTRTDPNLLRLFASSRFFVGIAIVGAFVGGVIILLYTTLMVFQVGWEALSSREYDVEHLDQLAVHYVELIDVFLLGIVLYLIAVGFYQLFINPDLPVPAWLRITDLDELKVKLVAVIIVMLGVNFLGVIEVDRETPVLQAGAAVALVIFAFSSVLFVYEKRRE